MSPQGAEVQCVECDTLFADVEAFDAHQHTICSTDNLEAFEQGGRTVYRTKAPEGTIRLQFGG